MTEAVRNSHPILKISLGVTSLMFLVPFVNPIHQYPIITFYSECLAIFLGLLGATILLSPTQLNKLHIPKVSFVFPILAILVLAQLALGILHSEQYAALVISYLIWAFAMTVLGSHLRQSFGWHTFVSTLAWGLIIAGIVNASVVILQIVMRTGGYIPFMPSLPNYGTLAQSNHFANLMALAISALIYLHVKGRFSRTFFFIILIWLLSAMSFSSSRSTWLYLIAGTCWAYILLRINKNNPEANTTQLLSITLWLVPIYACLQILLHFMIPDQLVSLSANRLTELATAETPSQRLRIWYDSLRLFFEAPIIGQGFGSMKAKTFLLLNSPAEMATNRMFEHAHNLFIHLLAETGLLGFSIVLIGITYWLKHLKWHQLNLETWWLLTALSIIGIHSMLEYPLWYAYFLGITAILLGAGSDISVKSHTSHLFLKYPILKSCTFPTIIIVFFLGWVLLASSWIANRHLTQLIFRKSEIEVERQYVDIVTSYSLLAPYQSLINAIHMKIEPDKIEEQFLLNQSAMHLAPLRKITYQHVALLMMKGQHTEAENLLKRTLHVYPYKDTYLSQYIPASQHQKFLSLLNNTIKSN